MIFLNFYEQMQSMLNRKNSAASIADYISKKIINNQKITSAFQISKETNFSPSTITKFVKATQYKNIAEIIFIQNQIINDKKNKKDFHNKDDVKITEAANIIEKANKIFFIGVSNGYSVNLDISRKLSRLDKWVVISDNKYEQIGLSRLLTESDVIITTSISLQHSWMIDIMKSTRTKIILLSSILPKKIKQKVDVFLKVDRLEDNSAFRVATINSRVQQFNYFDLIFTKLASFEHNAILLRATNYKS